METAKHLRLTVSRYMSGRATFGDVEEAFIMFRDEHPKAFPKAEVGSQLLTKDEVEDVEHHCGQCGWAGTGFHVCPGLPGEHQF